MPCNRAIHKRAAHCLATSRAQFGPLLRSVILVLLGLVIMACEVSFGGRPSDPAPTTTLRSFPGAEGFGAGAVGGRGGKVYQVTNLDDSGPGSLRACAEAGRPRICVFRTGGAIRLRSQLDIEDPYLTVAGQTAPGGGITLRLSPRYPKATLKIETHDVIIRGIRVRPGASTRSTSQRRGITIEGGAHDVIIDHVSVSWATDTNINVTDGARDITVQWSIISEALSHSTHSEGEHSKGISISGKRFTSSEQTGNVSLHHNILAHNLDRNPRNASWGLVDLVNNVIYNWGSSASQVADTQTKASLNVVGNFYEGGPDSTFIYGVNADTEEGRGVRIYVTGNIGPGRADDSQPQDNVVDPADRQWIVPRRLMAPSITTTSAHDASDHVLAHAGARVPSLDPVDQRVIHEIENGTGGIIDDPSQVGGWPRVAPGTPPPDRDHDGMPNDWEQAMGFNPGWDDSARDANGNGYTNVEEYINGLISMPMVDSP
jgi:pectate lyase